MGAHSFTSHYLWGGSDHWNNNRAGAVSAEQAYNTLCSEALHEHGHDPYNGTIATTEGFNVVTATPQTREQAKALIEERIENLSKWGPCEAIPLLEQTDDEWGRAETTEVTLTLSGADYADETKVRAALAKALKIKAEQIESYNSMNRSTYRHQVSVEKKVTAEAPKEKTETRYFILDGSGRLPRWEDGHPSQAEARKALPEVLRFSFGGAVPPVDVEIISMTRRVSGAPLVRARVEAKKVTVTYTVALRTLIRRGKVGTKQAGWVLYGWAAC